MKSLAVMLLLALASGCTTRKPGQSWPYVTRSFFEGDVIYHGVGVKF